MLVSENMQEFVNCALRIFKEILLYFLKICLKPDNEIWLPEFLGSTDSNDSAQQPHQKICHMPPSHTVHCWQCSSDLNVQGDKSPRHLVHTIGTIKQTGATQSQPA